MCAGGDYGIIAEKNMNLKDYIGEATAYDKKLMLERKDPTSLLKYNCLQGDGGDEVMSMGKT